MGRVGRHVEKSGVRRLGQPSPYRLERALELFLWICYMFMIYDIESKKSSGAALISENIDISDNR